MKKIILISAKARGGKDTTAEIMKEELKKADQSVLICHYADLLKYICKTFFDWNGEKDEKGRGILQYVGTDVIREQMPDFWLNFIIKILTLFYSSWDYVIIPDTRFPNEIDGMKEEFGDLGVDALRVTRDIDSGLTEEQLNHISETALDDYNFDWYINNNGTLEDLRRNVKDLLDLIA